MRSIRFLRGEPRGEGVRPLPGRCLAVEAFEYAPESCHRPRQAMPPGRDRHRRIDRPRPPLGVIVFGGETDSSDPMCAERF
jgi:hypothetical protein